MIAARTGDLAWLQSLLQQEPRLLDKRLGGHTLLANAAAHGQLLAVCFLIDSGANVNKSGVEGLGPLALAAAQGHVDCVEVLCAAGAIIDTPDHRGCTPLMWAATRGNTECTKVLSSYGASRELYGNSYGAPWEFYVERPIVRYDAERCAASQGHRQLASWLARTRDWTPLHHVEQLSCARTVALLRGGAELHVGSVSPLDRARQSQGEVSELILRAASWSPRSHELFPPEDRQYVVAMLRLGYQLAWSRGHWQQSAALVDVWQAYVLPQLVAHNRRGARRTFLQAET